MLPRSPSTASRPEICLISAYMDSTAIQIDGLTKGYRAHSVLRGVDLRLRAGEYMGLLGVNGAGKTTLIKAVLDFCQIDAGSIRLFDADHRDKAARARLAYLPERFTPPYYLSGREFLRYMGALHGVRYERHQVDDLFHHLDLDPAVLSRPVGALSKGMAQKLGLAACLLSGKELLLLDEPMSGLDPKARALFKTYLQERRQTNQTLFFTTHLLNDVETLCDRLAILHQGEARFVGSPQQCCAHYRADNLEQAYLSAIGATADRHAAA